MSDKFRLTQPCSSNKLCKWVQSVGCWTGEVAYSMKLTNCIIKVIHSVKELVSIGTTLYSVSAMTEFTENAAVVDVAEICHA